jgi:hypothetical protein
VTAITPGEAARVLYRRRHAQAPDIIRSQQCIRLCGLSEDDPAACREYKLAACAAEALECTHDEHEQCRAEGPDACDYVRTTQTQCSRCGAAYAPHQTGTGHWICDNCLREGT